MSVEIRDGKGTTYTAKVTASNQLSVLADSMPRAGAAAFASKLHGVTTDVIALSTTGSFNGVLYIQNNSALQVYVWHMVLFATVNARWQVVKNPTAGTLISGGTAVTPTNLNFASTVAYDGSVLKGANGDTVTDGTTFMYGGSTAFEASHVLDNTPLILGQSDALAILCRPAASGDVYASLVMSQENFDL